MPAPVNPIRFAIACMICMPLVYCPILGPRITIKGFCVATTRAASVNLFLEIPVIFSQESKSKSFKDSFNGTRFFQLLSINHPLSIITLASSIRVITPTESPL